MVSIPDDIQEGLKILSKSAKVDINRLKEQLKNIIETDEGALKIPEDQKEFKIRFAWALLRARYTEVDIIDVYIQPFSIPRARLAMIKGKSKYVGDICAKIKRIEVDDEGNETTGDVEYGAGTLWENAADNATRMLTNKVYRTRLKVIPKQVNTGNYIWDGVELGSNNAVFTEVGNIKFPTNQEYYNEFIKPIEQQIKIDLEEMSNNTNNNLIDIRVVKAEVIGVANGETSKGVEFGRYTIQDHSLLGGGTEGKPGGVAVWTHYDEAIWEKGSQLIFVGISQKDKDGMHRWKHHFALPTEIAMKRIIEVKAVEKESVDPYAEESFDNQATSDESELDAGIGQA